MNVPSHISAFCWFNQCEFQSSNNNYLQFFKSTSLLQIEKVKYTRNSAINKTYNRFSTLLIHSLEGLALSTMIEARSREKKTVMRRAYKNSSPIYPCHKYYVRRVTKFTRCAATWIICNRRQHARGSLPTSRL